MPPQIKRLAVLFAIFIGLFIVARYFLVPKSFGKYGHYRADSVEEVKALPMNYAGSSTCKTCHEDIYKLKASSKHATVACETCHGPAIKHAEDPMNIKPDKPKGRAFCGLCHTKNYARPKNMPQIDLEKHNEGMECYLCHNAHDPKI
ncbi:MAG: hypothetical protein COV46_02810 [Deltaproteobacteria bacterium CG11_big_fil_rev_8_21_14_0_20_49_13]|nr:MAG: hypothetical protein COV46_02810 [Deltaproteobacteria bacterium CG11_big_fil_rev_8_21_14_0_20_49_13]